MKWKVITPNLCITELHFMPKGYNIEDCTKIFLLRIYFARKVEKYLGPHPNCPICLSHFNQIWIFLTLLKSPPVLNCTRNIQLEPRCYLQTYRRTERQMDLHDEINRRFCDHGNKPKEALLSF